MAAKKLKPLSDYEWTLIWASMRYFMGRQTIASAMFPADFIKNSYSKLSEDQRMMVYRDLKSHFDSFNHFGNKDIDSPVWERLMGLMDDNNRYDVIAEGNGVERQTIECFKVGDTYYSVEKILAEPHRNWYVANELIIEVKSKNELV